MVALYNQGKTIRDGAGYGHIVGRSPNARNQIEDLWAYMSALDYMNYHAMLDGAPPIDDLKGHDPADVAEQNFHQAEALRKRIPSPMLNSNVPWNAGYVLGLQKYPNQKNVFVPSVTSYDPKTGMTAIESAAEAARRANKNGLEPYQMYNGRPVVADVFTGKTTPVTSTVDEDDGYNPNAQYMYNGRPIVPDPTDNVVQTSYKPESFYAGGLPEHLRNTAPGVLPDLTKDDVFNMIKAGSTSKVMPTKEPEPTFWDNLTTGFSNLAKTNPMAFISAPLDIWNAFSAQRNAKQALNLYRDQFNMSKQAYERNEARNQEQFDMFKHARATSQL